MSFSDPTTEIHSVVDDADLTDPRRTLATFDVERALEARVQRALFASGNLSRVYGIETSGGEQLVLKVRPDSVRLDAVAEVQTLMYRAGQPVPEPVSGPWRHDGLAMSVERLIPGGDTRDPGDLVARDFAEVFFALVRAAPPATAFVELRADAPAWVNWGTPETRSGLCGTPPVAISGSRDPRTSMRRGRRPETC